MGRIFLTGYMGAGKTTLGKALAQALGMEFIDMDWCIEQRYHKTVRELFVERGEDGFRDGEQAMLHEGAGCGNVMIATGGGTPCFFDNMEYMNLKGTTVFLEVTEETLFNRLQAGKHTRPILMNKTDEELRMFISSALSVRMPCYRKARYRFAADRLESRAQIEEAVKAFREFLQI